MKINKIPTANTNHNPTARNIEKNSEIDQLIALTDPKERLKYLTAIWEKGKNPKPKVEKKVESKNG